MLPNVSLPSHGSQQPLMVPVVFHVAPPSAELARNRVFVVPVFETITTWLGSARLMVMAVSASYPFRRLTSTFGPMDTVTWAAASAGASRPSPRTIAKRIEDMV